MMQRLKIILADPDSVYVDRVADYINTYYSSRIKLVVCTRLSLLEHYLRNNIDEFDFLLIHPEFLKLDSQLYKHIKFIVELTDDTSCALSSEDISRLYKYQPGNKMVNDLLKINTENSKPAPGAGEGIRSTKCITVFSPAGGVGKTSVALALAASLSENELEVLFLGMETFNSVPLVLEINRGEGFTKVLLALHENPQLIAGRIEMNKTRDRDYKFHILEPPECFFELSELEKEQLELLLTNIKQACKYDVVVIDTDSSLGSDLITLLNNSDKGVMVGTTEELCKNKIISFAGQLRMLEAHETEDILNKTVLLINKVQGNDNYDVLTSGFSNTCTVPFVEKLFVPGSNGKLHFDRDRQLIENIRILTNILGYRDDREFEL